MNSNLIDLWIKESVGRQVMVIDVNTKIIACNAEANKFLDVDLVELSLDDLLVENIQPVIKAGLLFCIYIQDQCLRKKENVISFEQFNGRGYLSLRFFICYKGRSCLLVDIQEVSGDYANVNKVQTLDV